MSMPINNITTGAVRNTFTSEASTKPSDAGKRFEQTLSAALDTLAETEAHSDDLMARLAAGEDVDIHEVMIAMEETNVQFRVAMACRDHLVDAYKQIMNMSV